MRISHASYAPRLAWSSVASPFPGDTSAEFTATTERTVPAERADIARKFVGNGVAMTQMDTVAHRLLTIPHRFYRGQGQRRARVRFRLTEADP